MAQAASEKNQRKSTGRGGRRPGAGRKPGSVNQRTREFAEAALKSGQLTPLDFMLSAMRDEAREYGERFEAAKAAAPYVHAKLAAVDANVNGDMSFTIVVNKP